MEFWVSCKYMCGATLPRGGSQVPGIMANKEETLFIKIRNDNFNERVVPLRRYA